MITNHNNTLCSLQLLSAKLLHDLSGPITTVSNYSEMLYEDDENSNVNDYVRLLKSSSNHIINRFKILQQAYSFSYDNTNFQETKKNIQLYLHEKGVDLEWTTEDLQIDNKTIEKINKLLCNIIILNILVMIRGKKISIDLKKDTKKVTAIVTSNAEKVSIPELTEDALNGKNVELSTKNIQAHFIYLLSQNNNIKISYNISDKSLKFSADFMVL